MSLLFVKHTWYVRCICIEIPIPEVIVKIMFHQRTRALFYLFNCLTFGTFYEANHIFWRTHFDEGKIRIKSHLNCKGGFTTSNGTYEKTNTRLKKKNFKESYSKLLE